jgi:hypothetical protein
MSPHELNGLKILHVSGVLVLIAYTFFAFAGSPETRKRVLMITGIATLLVLLTGIRMWQGLLAFKPLGWVVIKLVCWLALSAVSGLAYRKREMTNTLMVVTLVLAILAVAMVFVKPF